MRYNFTTLDEGNGMKLVRLRGRNIRWIMVKTSTSPKKFLRFFQELKRTGRIAYAVYEIPGLAELFKRNSEEAHRKILGLAINESCVVDDTYDSYEVTRISRNLCHSAWIGTVD